MRFDFEELEEMRRRNLEQNWRLCLGGCGRRFLTDRTHRICGRCAAGREELVQAQIVRGIPFKGIGACGRGGSALMRPASYEDDFLPQVFEGEGPSLLDEALRESEKKARAVPSPLDELLNLLISKRQGGDHITGAGIGDLAA